MLYTGEFADMSGAAVRVEIETEPGGNAGTPVVGIGGDQLLFDSGSPVVITGETNDFYDVAFRQTGTIRLLARRFQPELFKGDIMQTRVSIDRAGQPVFRGFVLPQTYSQPYEEEWDSLEINIVDCLSALEHLRWSDVMGDGETPVTFRAATEGALSRLFPHMRIELSGRYMSGAADMMDFTVNPRVFMGEDEDDETSYLSALEEILRFNNLHIAQEGDLIRMWPIDETWTTAPVMIDRATSYGTGHNIEICETYNEISAAVDVQGLDELFPAPLDDNNVGSPYDRSQLYCTEFNSRGDGWSAPAMYPMLMGESYPEAHDDHMWRRDWYVRVMTCPGWEFCDNEIGHEWGGEIPVNERRKFYPLTDEEQGRNQQRVPNQLTCYRGAALLEVTSGKTSYTDDDHNPPPKLEGGKYLVVGVGGSGDQSKWSVTELMNRRGIPRAVYYGDSETSLSPSDETVTRYVVISGSIALAPAVVTARPWSAWQDFVDNELQDIDPVIRSLYVESFLNAIPTQEGDGRILLRRYWQAETPSAPPQPADNITGTAGTAGGYLGLDMYSPDESAKYWQYTGVARLKNFQGEWYSRVADTRGKLGVLVCMLIVGDKCVVETPGDGSAANFSWKTFRPLSECASRAEFLRQTFTIGFDPKNGDWLVGPEYDIANNVTYDMHIDEEGMAIPVRAADDVHGAVRFLVLGPADLVYSANTLSEDRYGIGTGGEVWPSDAIHIMEQVSAIWLKGLSVEIVSDNGGSDPIEESDLVYISDTDEGYRNKKDDVKFLIGSDLTAAEREQTGFLDKPCRNLISGLTEVEDTVTGKTGKPEQLWVDWYWRQNHLPSIEIEHTVKDPFASMFRTYRHQAFAGMRFYPIRLDRDLREVSATIRLRQILDQQEA